MIGTFTEGQRVRVYPHGSPEETAMGTVRLISRNQLSIAVSFDHLPPFAFRRMPVVGVHPEYAVVMLLSRYDVGPWVEMAGRGHYEIEESHEN